MTSAGPIEGKHRSHETLAIAALLAIATALRLTELNSQLWIDEISALTGSIQRPFGEIATRWPGSVTHVLYELLARAGFLLFGAPIGIRLPAAIFGVAGVALAYVFARGAFGRRPALVIASLTALSYHHVFFSQNARGYTLLISLFLATLALLVEAERRREVHWPLLTLYALAGALAAYSMPMGVFILPGQALVVLGLWWRAKAKGEQPPLAPSLVGAAVGGGLLAAALYAPFIVAALRFTRMNVATPEEGPRLGFALVREVLDGLLGAFHGPVGLAVVAIFGLAGLVSWWRRHPTSLLAALAPLVLQGIVLVGVGIGIHPRYFAIALPVLLIVAGLGLEAVVVEVSERVSLPPHWRARAIGAVLTAALLVSAWPLRRYYRYPKQDFIGAIAAIEARRPPCRVRVGVDVAGHVLEDYYHAGFVTVENLDELLALEGKRVTSVGSGPACVVTTLEGLLATSDPDIVDHLRKNYRRVAWLPGTVGDAAMRIYEREP